ncbi:hypothetical protein [Arthrobacter bambusae]|uniref:Uncharacterized protein n=1 Tax=Arthrobacter bambusae TaxID=1338426 RepID=A0AAW8DFF1_9MICC|nr:hypothetical protein [Arthrobacter bambusae]MDP9904626.1 hypothetical protein [Arthrobacter bambusae]MDQ0129442.1 hypothetical protein [Arthrobacter bambusae]MDQ0180945.1 hypothetical protein [Arthrobacter bambusae]
MIPEKGVVLLEATDDRGDGSPCGLQLGVPCSPAGVVEPDDSMLHVSATIAAIGVSLTSLQPGWLAFLIRGPVVVPGGSVTNRVLGGHLLAWWMAVTRVPAVAVIAARERKK